MKESWDTREVGLHLSNDEDTFHTINREYQIGAGRLHLKGMLQAIRLPDSCKVNRSNVDWDKVLDYVIY